MNNPHNTATAFQDQLNEIQEIMEREKVKLTPELESYLNENIQQITEMVAQGQMLTREDLEFFEELKLWMGMPEIWREKYPSIDAIHKNDEVKNIYKESKKRDISMKQWIDLLHVADSADKDINWINETFQFHGEGKIEVLGNLDLKNCASLTALPDNLSIIEGILDLSYCTSLTTLPRNLSIKGSLILYYCTSLTTIQENLTVSGSLNLCSCTSLTALPDDLSIEGRGFLELSENLHEQVMKDVERLQKEGRIKGEIRHHRF